MLFAVINTVKNIFPVSQKFSVLQQNSLFSLSGKSKNQIPCFPWAVATLCEVKIKQKIKGKKISDDKVFNLFYFSALILLLKDSSSDVRVKAAEAMSKLFDF